MSKFPDDDENDDDERTRMAMKAVFLRQAEWKTSIRTKLVARAGSRHFDARKWQLRPRKRNRVIFVSWNCTEIDLVALVNKLEAFANHVFAKLFTINL